MRTIYFNGERKGTVRTQDVPDAIRLYGSGWRTVYSDGNTTIKQNSNNEFIKIVVGNVD